MQRQRVPAAAAALRPPGVNPRTACTGRLATGRMLVASCREWQEMNDARITAAGASAEAMLRFSAAARGSAARLATHYRRTGDGRSRGPRIRMQREVGRHGGVGRIGGQLLQ